MRNLILTATALATLLTMTETRAATAGSSIYYLGNEQIRVTKLQASDSNGQVSYKVELPKSFYIPSMNMDMVAGTTRDGNNAFLFTSEFNPEQANQLSLKIIDRSKAALLTGVELTNAKNSIWSTVSSGIVAGKLSIAPNTAGAMLLSFYRNNDAVAVQVGATTSPLVQQLTKMGVPLTTISYDDPNSYLIFSPSFNPQMVVSWGNNLVDSIIPNLITGKTAAESFAKLTENSRVTTKNKIQN